MTSLLVGCPVLRREWIIGAWMNHVEISCGIAGVDPSYIFVCDPRDPTRKAAELRAAAMGRSITFIDVEDKVDDPHSHAWGNTRNLHHMVDLRNMLLAEVRELAPDVFLSLDSDILCHPQQVANLMETITGGFDAVGGKVYLSPGRDCPSWGSFSKERGLTRSDADYVMEVDVIMAIKLMMPSAYHVDYEFEHNGEDIGWSLNCRANGLRLGWDGRVASKHVMEKTDGNGASLIDKIDGRVGF